MDWVTGLQRAIDYMEEHLTDELDLSLIHIYGERLTCSTGRILLYWVAMNKFAVRGRQERKIVV